MHEHTSLHSSLLASLLVTPTTTRRSEPLFNPPISGIRCIARQRNRWIADDDFSAEEEGRDDADDVFIAEDGEASWAVLREVVGGWGGEVDGFGARYGEEEDGVDWCPAEVFGVLEDLRAESTFIDGTCTTIVLLEDIGTNLDEAEGWLQAIVAQGKGYRSPTNVSGWIDVNRGIRKHQIDAITNTTTCGDVKHIPPTVINPR
jgi:hypothetical protein